MGVVDLDSHRSIFRSFSSSSSSSSSSSLPSSSPSSPTSPPSIGNARGYPPGRGAGTTRRCTAGRCCYHCCLCCRSGEAQARQHARLGEAATPPPGTGKGSAAIILTSINNRLPIVSVVHLGGYHDGRWVDHAHTQHTHTHNTHSQKTHDCLLISDILLYVMYANSLRIFLTLKFLHGVVRCHDDIVTKHAAAQGIGCIRGPFRCLKAHKDLWSGSSCVGVSCVGVLTHMVSSC